ncbi:aminoglycoside phosphotransferase family protein [Nocardiopsis sp. NPDC007018]|uniref:aminoglycoside phosphotransferase family protein n=1 Tax=Nocardiopsis sp. NPDC007018 TaxID=3155721 RepID=UPI0033C01464
MTRPAPPEPPPIDTELVRRLVDDRFPEWSGLPLRPVRPGGLDHVIHRLGDDLSVRLPRHAEAAGQVERESRWLPRLAPCLPLAVPEPVAVGEPGFGYPWRWSVSRWLPGDTAAVETLADSAAQARGLARFLVALQRNTPPRVPERLVGEPLALRGSDLEAVVSRVTGVFDPRALTSLWEEALDAPAWNRPPVWFHGDFHTGNLLTRGGEVSAVIDFGTLGVGDPARDLTIAFTLMSPAARAEFRAELGAGLGLGGAQDDALWARGRGWALITGLRAYAAHAEAHPAVAAQTIRQIEQALLD